MDTAVCPQCGREIKVRMTRFGDRVFARHKMGTAWTKSGMPSESVKADLTSPYNAGAPYTHEIDCPMSGQVIE